VHSNVSLIIPSQHS